MMRKQRLKRSGRGGPCLVLSQAQEPFLGRASGPPHVSSPRNSYNEELSVSILLVLINGISSRTVWMSH